MSVACGGGAAVRPDSDVLNDEADDEADDGKQPHLATEKIQFPHEKPFKTFNFRATKHSGK